MWVVRTSLYDTIRQRSHSRQRQSIARSDGRRAGHAGTLGHRRASQQSMVGRGGLKSGTCRRLPCPAFHQLQYGRRLVRDDFAHHHGELERGYSPVSNGRSRWAVALAVCLRPMVKRTMSPFRPITTPSARITPPIGTCGLRSRCSSRNSVFGHSRPFLFGRIPAPAGAAAGAIGGDGSGQGVSIR